MIILLRRNLLVFFRDRTAVFFSLLSVFIVIGLYALFLGNALVSGLGDIGNGNARLIMDTWIMAGILAVTSVTTTMGAFGIMIDDRIKKIDKDILSAPIKRSAVAGGYVLAAFTIGVIMCVVTFILSQIFLVTRGGEIASLEATLKVAGLVLITSLTNTSLIFLLVTFLRSQNAFATASTIVGTTIGFLTGIYLPIGNMPEGVQVVAKLFPPTHAASLFRQVLLEAPVKASQIPDIYVDGMYNDLGVKLTLGGYTFPPIVSLAILVVSGVLFFSLAVINVSKKKT